MRSTIIRGAVKMWDSSLQSDCTSNRRSMRWCFAWTKRPPSKPWTGLIRCCHCRPGGWSATALSTIATAPFRCTPRLTRAMGEVVGKTAARHTSQEFVAFLAEVVANQPRGKEIHLIADNLAAHKTKRVEQFLTAHPKVHLHYTPTYSSWLNQVENWFARIEREVIARGVFTSVKDLARKLMRYIRHYNRAPKPIKWTYRDPSHRISLDTNVTVTGH